MASSGKKKTTFAKLARESRLRERRMEKQARKDARKGAPDTPPPPLSDIPPAEELLTDASDGEELPTDAPVAEER